MADKIKLPALPALDFEECTDGATFSCDAGYSPETLRARDIEVAKCVLEAVADRLEHDEYGGYLVDEIRALKVTHD